MLKKVLISLFGILAVGVVGVLGVASTKPDTFHLERSLVINAPAEKIYPHINDFHKWQAWSPFEKLDPTMKKEFGGPESGKGSTYHWSGNGQAGEGTMEIVETVPSSKVKIDLHFTKPMAGDDVALFTLVPEGEGTKVTWAMDGPSPLMHKVMTVFMSFEKMMAPTFDEGLTALKNIAEKK
jgi:hypothetical protein